MPPVISSPHNPRIRLAVSLRDRKHRRREGLMRVEGAAEIALALESGALPRTVFVCPDLHAPAQPAPAVPDGVEVLETTAAVFEKLAYRQHPDGWLGLFGLPARGLDDLRLPPNPLVVAAERVEKPGNLGAILRTAEAAGAAALIVCDPAADLYNPNVVTASKGTLFALPVIECESSAALAWLRRNGLSVLAATPTGTLAHTQADLRGPLAVALGAEDAGLSSLWLEAADLRVRIPMAGRVNSLNVSAAAAVLLYEAVRQRSQPAP